MAIILYCMNCLFCMGFAFTYTYFQRWDYLSWYLFILTSDAQKQYNTGTLSAKHTLDRPTINHSSVCNPVVYFRSLQYTIWSGLPKYKWPLLLADITANRSISNYTGYRRPKHQWTKCDLFLITITPQSFTTLAIFIASSYLCTCTLIIGIETLQTKSFLPSVLVHYRNQFSMVWKILYCIHLRHSRTSLLTLEWNYGQYHCNCARTTSYAS